MRLYWFAALSVACGSGSVSAPFGLDTRPPNPTCVAPAMPPSEMGGIKLTPMFAGAMFDRPTAMRQRPGDPSTFYVIAQPGVVWRINADGSNKTMWLDLTDRVNASGSELGLLGIDFHPTKPEVFVSYTTSAASAASGIRSIVARFQIAADGSVDRGTIATEDRILPPNDDSPNLLDQPYTNHNGGNILFGPDGLLYYGLGDGGSEGDPQMRGQNTQVPFGKMLRVDVDNAPAGQRYAIPPTNPFASGTGGLPEIYAWGLRNPWRWSFDRATGDFWVGDVGQNMYEEVDRLQLGGNYGWSVREGFHCYNATTCPSAGFIDPIVEYDHTQGIAITGGYVYRGTAIDALIGTYLFSDYGSGRIWAIVYDTNGAASIKDLLDTNVSISSFSEGLDGELYVMVFAVGTGSVSRIDADTTAKPVGGPALQLSQTGCVLASDPSTPVPGVIPYAVAAPLWSDGADKTRGFAIPDGSTINVGADGDMDLPIGSVAMKTFSVAGQRVETRLFMRHADGTWAGYSYEWADDGSDATLLPANKTKTLANQQSWLYPSRAQCLDCHTQAAGHTLGLELNQLDLPITYPSTQRVSNQVDTLNHIGMFGTATLPPYERLPTPGAPFFAVDGQARAYLHSNCSFCHRPGGNGRGNMDIRWSTPLAMTGLCDAPQLGDLGVTGALLVAPGSPSTSIVSLRTHALDVNRMPPLATSIVDDNGTQVLDRWISSLTSCP